jgi:hypothetical protein
MMAARMVRRGRSRTGAWNMVCVVTTHMSMVIKRTIQSRTRVESIGSSLYTLVFDDPAWPRECISGCW